MRRVILVRPSGGTMRSFFGIVFGFSMGFTIGYLITNRIAPRFWQWIDRLAEERTDHINRQRAANMGIRFDMNRHPAEKGDNWK
jgi:hypothetical protein